MVLAEPFLVGLPHYNCRTVRLPFFFLFLQKPRLFRVPFPPNLWGFEGCFTQTLSGPPRTGEHRFLALQQKCQILVSYEVWTNFIHDVTIECANPPPLLPALDSTVLQNERPVYSHQPLHNPPSNNQLKTLALSRKKCTIPSMHAPCLTLLRLL